MAARAHLIALIFALTFATALAQQPPPAGAEQPAPASAEGGQAPAAAGPEPVFDRFMEKMRAGDWNGCAVLMHPEALTEFTEIFSAIVQQDASGEAAKHFFGVEKPEQVTALSPEVAFARLLGSIMDSQAGMREALGSATAKVIGTVPEDAVVHVVYRLTMTVQGATISKIAVAPFKKHDGVWRALLSGEMEGIVQALRSKMGG